MLTDTIQISGLPETVIQGVSDRAKAVGTTAEEYVRYLIEEDLSSSSSICVFYSLPSKNK